MLLGTHVGINVDNILYKIISYYLFKNEKINEETIKG